jgi:transposase
MGYTGDEKQRIRILLRSSKDTRMYKRYQVIHLHMKGLPNARIAEIVDLHQVTVGIYVNTYKTSGVDGLVPKKPPGRPSFLSKEQEQQLYNTIKENTPEEVGFEGIKNWTAKLACHWVFKEFGIQYQVNGMLDMFHRLKLSYTRPTYVLAKADPKKQEEFMEEFEDVKKKLIDGKIAHILFEDESAIRDYQAIMKSWFAKGEQKLIKTYGKHESVKLIGILNYETGRVHIEEAEEFNAKVFLEFLKKVLAWYPEGEIVMILDNSRVHHAILLKEFLEANPRLNLMFLPPYSPKLNIIEGLWGWLKDTCINNVFFDKFYKVKIAIRKFVTLVNSNPNGVINRLCVQL